MTKRDLLSEELSNLYAISKQIIDYLNGSDIYFLSEKSQLLLVDYLKLNCKNEELITEALRTLKINPGNTKDSIVAEITKNLNSIVGHDIDEDVKSEGYVLSLNRLLGYQLVNIQNVKYTGGENECLHPVIAIENELRLLKEKLFS